MDWPILSGLTSEERRAVLARMRRRRFEPNEVIFHEGDPGDTLHFVARGFVAIRVTTPLGDIVTVRIVRAGEFFGELAVVSPGPRSATAVALERTETLGLHRDQFEDIRTSHPHVDQLLIAALAGEVRRLAAQLLDAMHVPVEKRVWRRLVELTDTFQSSDGDGTRVPLTQEHIAQVVGTTRPTVNRLLRAAEANGELRIGRGCVDVLDIDAIVRRTR